MNKKVIGIAVISLILLLSSCGMSEEAKMADDLIAKIGTVTLNNETSILAAEAAVDALPQEQQQKLKNMEQLKEARSTFNKLEAERVSEEIAMKASAVIKAIDAIGEVTLDSEDEITNALEKYDALEEGHRYRVSNYSKLKDAQEKYSQLQRDYVTGLISAIGTNITLNSEAAIQEAQKAYDKLSFSDQIQISSAYSTLEKAVQSLWEYKKKTMDSDERFEKETDLFNGLTWYKSAKTKYITRICPYICIAENKSIKKVGLALEFLCISSSLILFDEVIINVDGVNYYQYFNSDQISYMQQEKTNLWLTYGNIMLEDDSKELEKTITNYDELINSSSNSVSSNNAKFNENIKAIIDTL